MESMYQQLHSLAQSLTQTPWLMENVLYADLMPKKPFTALVDDGNRRIKQRCPAIESYIFCPDVAHQNFLPLTLWAKDGIEKSNIQTPYKNAVTIKESEKKGSYKELILRAMAEYPRENSTLEPPTEEFIAVIDLHVKDGVFETTHIGHLPENLQRVRRIDIANTTRHSVELPKPAVKDPVLQVGIESSGRYKNADISDFTGELSLYALGEAIKLTKGRGG